PLAMRRRDRIEMTPRRVLRPPQLRAVDGFADPPRFHALDRVAEPQSRDRRRRLVEPLDDPADQRRVRKGPRAVMDQHALRLVRGERFKAEPYRILPLRAARYGRKHR